MIQPTPKRVPLAVFIFLSVIALATGTQAQTAPEPDIQIMQVDVSEFPEVHIYLRGTNLGADLEELPVTIAEDGAAVVIEDSTLETPGTQTAFLLDASGSTLDLGPSGEPIFVEAGAAIEALLQQQSFSNSDWLALFVAQPDEQLAIAAPWTIDHQTIVNKIYELSPPADESLTTPVYELLFYTLDRFAPSEATIDARVAPARPAQNTGKAIVLFSDGVSGQSSVGLDDITRRAAAAGIPIHTVLLGAGTPETQQDMERIAMLTGGQALRLEGSQTLLPLGRIMERERVQRVLTYTSTNASAQNLTVTVQLPNQGSRSETASIPRTTLRAAALTLRVTPSDPVIIRQASSANATLRELEPRVITVTTDFEWPDGHPREIVSMLYRVGGVVMERKAGPFERPFEFSIDNLSSGSYALEVEATDSLGLVGRAAPHTLTIDALVPERSLCVLGAAICLPASALSSVLAALSFCLAGAALIVAYRNPRGREIIQRTTARVSENLGRITRPLGALLGQSVQHRGVLIIESSGADQSIAPAQEFPIDDKASFGAVGTDYIINDPYVSGRHCSFEYVSGNRIRVRDHSTNGTFVNDIKVPEEGLVLETGQQVRLGQSVRFRFQYGSLSKGGSSSQRRPTDRLD